MGTGFQVSWLMKRRDEVYNKAKDFINQIFKQVSDGGAYHLKNCLFVFWYYICVNAIRCETCSIYFVIPKYAHTHGNTLRGIMPLSNRQVALHTKIAKQFIALFILKQKLLLLCRVQRKKHAVPAVNNCVSSYYGSVATTRSDNPKHALSYARNN